MPSDWARRCAEAIRGGGRSEYLRYALLPRVFTIPGASSLARMKDTVGAWYEGSPHPQLSIRDVQPAGPPSCPWKWPWKSGSGGYPGLPPFIAWLSTTMSRPPGRSTRIHSSIAPSGCGNVHKRCRLMAISKLAAVKGSCSASASS